MAKSHTVKVPEHIRDRVDAEIQRCIDIAEKHYDNRFEFPRIEYDLRGTTAGTASDWDYTIKLNSILLMENRNDGFIDGPDSTVAHEFAHLIDGLMNPHTRERTLKVNRRGGRSRSKRSVHGPTWKRIMVLLGCNATDGRCHDYDVTNAKTKIRAKHEWRCVCGNEKMMMTNKTHERQRMYSSYWARGHKNCGGFNYHGTVGNISETPLITPVAPKQPRMMPRRTPTITPPTTPKPKPRNVSQGFSKTDLAATIYKLHGTRKDTIASLVSDHNMTKAQAAYYFKKVS